MGELALDDEVEVRWRELAGEVLTGFRAWREAHPTAPRSESAAARAGQRTERPRCPAWGAARHGG